jgi:hypothetical protein
MDKQKCLKLWNSAYEHLVRNEPETLEWAERVSEDTFRNLRGKTFLRHYCFVVYASGFRYHTIKACFADLSEAYHYFDLERLSRMRSLQPVLKVFGSQRKARNFLDGARAIAQEGFQSFKRRLAKEGPCVLTELPGIGPITKDHLAKNIGLVDTAKPDVWLVRAASYCGAATVSELVDFLHGEIGKSKHVIDVALWTYSRDGNLPGYSKMK